MGIDGPQSNNPGGTESYQEPQSRLGSHSSLVQPLDETPAAALTAACEIPLGENSAELCLDF